MYVMLWLPRVLLRVRTESLGVVIGYVDTLTTALTSTVDPTNANAMWPSISPCLQARLKALHAYRHSRSPKAVPVGAAGRASLAAKARRPLGRWRSRQGVSPQNPV